MNRSPASVSVILTVIVLVLLAMLSVLLQLVAVNGADQTSGITAMGISLACQGVVILLLGIFAARATTFLISKVGWDRILAVAATVMVAAVIGGTISFLSMIISIPLAGIR